LGLSNEGKSALIFFPHSTNIFNDASYLDIIRSVISNILDAYENVVLLLHFKDLKYKSILSSDKRLIISTIGHNRSRLFLSRLRSLIEWADVTFSFSIGTHISYSIAMDKPHKIIILDDIRFNRSQYIYNKPGHFDYLTSEQKIVFDKTENLLLEVFGSKSVYIDSISSEQIRVANELWANNVIIQQEELRRFYYDET